MLPNIIVPTFKVELPISKKKLECRPYLVKEDKILLMAAQDIENKSAISTATRQVINACVLEDNFDVASLSAIDADYLFVHVRAKSVGETVDLDITCNKETNGKTCGHTFKVLVSLNDLKIEGEEPENKIQINKDVGIKMKPTSFSAVLNSVNFTTEIENNINIIYNSIDYIYNKEEIITVKDFTQKEFNDWVENLDSKSFAKLIGYIENQPKLIIEKKTNCPKCGAEHELRFEDSVSFF